MNNLARHTAQLLLLTLALILSVSCLPFLSSEPSLSNVTLCTSLNDDNSPQNITDVFYIDSPRICCAAKLSGAQAETTVGIRWLYTNAEQSIANKIVYKEIQPCARDGYISFMLPVTAQGFDAGEYSVSLSISDTEKASAVFSIGRDVSVPLPQIKKFTIDKTTITHGEEALLRWDIKGANRITIEPGIADVQSTGSTTVKPQSDTGYTIYALNKNGCTLSSLAIKVKPVIKEKADLIITEFWPSGNVLSYKIKNIGTAESCGTETYFYRNNRQESIDFVAPLAPGEERAEQFAQYHFSLRFTDLMGTATTNGINIRVRANGANTCQETDDSNNCMEHNFGTLSTFDMVKTANKSDWSCSTGNLQWPMFPNGDDGYVVLSQTQMQPSGISGNSILMCPPKSDNGWIQGVYGDRSVEYPHALKPRSIPHLSKFTAKVGLSDQVPADASARFRFGIMRGGEIQYFPEVTVTSKDEFKYYEVDLKDYADQQVLYVLRVESNTPLKHGCAEWVEPLISQSR